MRKTTNLPATSDSTSIKPTELFTQFHNPKKRAFLAAFCQSGRIVRACKEAGIHWTSHYGWLRRDKTYESASIHPNGKQYRWEVPINGGLPKLPVELFKLISSPSSTGETSYRERFNTAQALAGVPEGQRDETLFRLACKFRHADVPQDMAEILILEAAKNCEPPFSERLALEKIERAYRKFKARQTEKKNSEVKRERTPITVKVSDVEREEVSWLWKDRIPRGKLTIIEGDPGEGKSFLSQAIATAITRGFGLPGEEKREPETVLIMSAEDGLADTIRPRLEDMGADV